MFTHSLILAIAAQIASIEGQVVDAATHGSIPFARVELLFAQTPLDRQFTDKEGRFAFAKRAAGPYTVSVEYSGYETTSVVVDTLAAKFPVTIELVRKKAPPLSGPGLISVRELTIPERARKEFDLARRYAQRQDCAKAIRHFEIGLRSFDQDPAAHNDLGNCYRKLSQYDEAEKEFLQADSRPHQIPDVHLILAELYLRKKEPAAAVKHLELYLKEAPTGAPKKYVRQVRKGIGL